MILRPSFNCWLPLPVLCAEAKFFDKGKRESEPILALSSFFGVVLFVFEDKELGMNPILNQNAFFVKEHVGLLKAANNYGVLDPANGQTILHCREDRLGFLPKFCVSQITSE